jgi:mannose-6-phosphate isomerase-like protein (cupin superfamily)
MKGFIGNIETQTVENRDFRRVIYTSEHAQLVLMTLQPGEEIGEEVHEDIDQFFRVEKGTGEVVIDSRRTPIEDGTAILVPAGSRHNVMNTGAGPLQVYTLYAPPHHEDGTVQHTKADADASTEHFTGRTTE